VCSELLQACAELPPPHLVVLDLTDVSFFGAAAVHAIRQFAAATAGRGVRTHLVADPDGIVARVVTLAGLDDVLPTFTTLAQAT
jgi:anti-anti-sigma factor